MKLFKTSAGHLRQLWWVAVFFLVLAALTFPAIVLTQHYKWEITITHQALIVIGAVSVPKVRQLQIRD